MDLKETNPRIAQLLDIPAAEVRRLRELAAAPASPRANDEPATDADEENGPAHHTSSGDDATADMNGQAA